MLSRCLFRAEQVRALDRRAIEDQGIPARELMERAGGSAFKLLRQRWPAARRITVVCGLGNNAGDGYVVARYALDAGLKVMVSQVGDATRLKGEAQAAYQAMCETGQSLASFSLDHLHDRDLIVDGLFGTGLSRVVEGPWGQAIEAINDCATPVLALDIPSGLNSDTGSVLGEAVRASATISFVGLKRGMFTGLGPSCCGEIELSDLSLPAEVYAGVEPSAMRLLPAEMTLAPRERHAHKGHFGHVLVAGSDRGYTGAARLAAEAAARVGAGLVSIATRESHAATIAGNRSELMGHGVESGKSLQALIDRASVIAIGPGLGQSDWARALLDQVFVSSKPMVVDADALNLLSNMDLSRQDWITTPHPGEAARLLGVDTSVIQADRFEAITQLQRRYGGVCVLKGAGTLIAGGDRIHVCEGGNPGMASGGMGDVLTGVIAGLLAQHLGPEEAACLGVWLHSEAADIAAQDGERGLLARDLMPILRRLVNQP